MPKFTVEHSTSTNAIEAFEKVKKFLLEDADLKKIDPQLKVEFNEPLKQCQIKSSKFKSEVQIETSGASTKVSILVDLPLLLSPFKSQISEMLKKKLMQHLS